MFPGSPTWSRDGSIAVAQLTPYSRRSLHGLNHILVMSSDGAPVRSFAVLAQRSVDTRLDSGPVWAPDGTRMALVMDGALWTLPVSLSGEPAGPPRKLTSELASFPSWTGDSKTILASSARLRFTGPRRITRIPQPIRPKGTFLLCQRGDISNLR